MQLLRMPTNTGSRPANHLEAFLAKWVFAVAFAEATVVLEPNDQIDSLSAVQSCIAVTEAGAGLQCARKTLKRAPSSSTQG